MVQLSRPYMTTRKTMALTVQTSVSKVMSLLLSTLSRFVIAFLPRSKSLFIANFESVHLYLVGILTGITLNLCGYLNRITIFFFYNIVLISAVQQSDCYTYTHNLFSYSFPLWFIQDDEYRSRCHTLEPSCLSSLCILVCIR